MVVVRLKGIVVQNTDILELFYDDKETVRMDLNGKTVYHFPQGEPAAVANLKKVEFRRLTITDSDLWELTRDEGYLRIDLNHSTIFGCTPNQELFNSKYVDPPPEKSSKRCCIAM